MVKNDVRRYKRIRFKRPIKFKVKGREAVIGHIAQDLSEGGVRFFSPEFVPVDTVVTVQIQLRNNGRVLDLEGRVAWVRSVPMADRYQLGIEFANLEVFKRTVIGEFVKFSEKETM